MSGDRASGAGRRGADGAGGARSAGPRPVAGDASPGKGSAGRVVAGSARGIRLVAPGEGTRPLADRVKQALFAILEPDLAGARVLDLFAGSGAGGIEALSRGAEAAVFVERDAGAIATIKANLARTHLAGPSAVVVRAEVLRWLAGASGPVAGPYDIVLLDPPYERPELLGGALAELGRGRLLAGHATIVAKHFWKEGPPERTGLLRSVRERRFGETALTFYRRGTGSDDQPAGPEDRPAGSDEEDG